jgi:hypothetical protein
MTLRSLSVSCQVTLGLVLLLIGPHPVRAQGGALSTTLDPSVRASGMGRAAAAVWWGVGPNAWANPALLGYERGVRYESGETQLIPDLANDVYFRSKRVLVGGGGLGVLNAGKPIHHLGNMRLSYGISQVTGPTGEPLGTFESYEELRPMGVGVCLGQAIETVARLAGRAVPRLSRYGDIAVGWAQQDVEVELTPALPGLPGFGSGRTHTEDVGLLVRLTPLDSFTGAGMFHGKGDVVRARLDVSFALSDLNRHRAALELGGPGGSADPTIEQKYQGWAARLALHPAGLSSALERDGLGWLDRTVSPMLSFGAAWDEYRQEYLSSTFADPTPRLRTSDSDYRGWELTFLQVLSLRRGTVHDPDGSIHGTTTGWGVGASLAGALSVRYDHATVPQATDPTSGISLARVDRKAWTIAVDPVRAVHELRHRNRP